MKRASDPSISRRVNKNLEGLQITNCINVVATFNFPFFVCRKNSMDEETLFELKYQRVSGSFGLFAWLCILRLSFIVVVIVYSLN